MMHLTTSLAGSCLLGAEPCASRESIETCIKMACEVVGVRYSKGTAVATDVLRMFDTLELADSEGMLAEVRALVAGTDHEVMYDAKETVEHEAR
jgi:hypothetical protein